MMDTHAVFRQPVGRRLLVLGCGKSGLAAAELIRREGGTPVLLDRSPSPGAVASLAAKDIACIASESTLPEGFFDGVVTSPSVTPEHPWLREAGRRSLPVISELELGALHWQGRVIALTGSKGKSSAVKCLTDTLCLAGHRAFTAGNYGTPLCARVLECESNGKDAVAVTEVSSFQMEHTTAFAPELAAILNLQADHLDRHGTMAVYRALKFRLFSAQRPERGDTAFLPTGLRAPEDRLPQGLRTETFGTDAASDWRYDAGAVIGPHGLTVPVAGYFRNPVLGCAAALITAMLSRFGISPAAIAEGFRTFVPLDHRMQRLTTVHGVTYIDDSKATTLTATAAALRMTEGPVRLIAGGLLKESDLTFILPILRERVAKAYIIGKDTRPLLNAWSDAIPCADCGTMAVAVGLAASEASPGDTVLLSPGTASFDQYPGMAARGRDFAANLPFA